MENIPAGLSSSEGVMTDNTNWSKWAGRIHYEKKEQPDKCKHEWELMGVQVLDGETFHIRVAKCRLCPAYLYQHEAEAMLNEHGPQQKQIERLRDCVTFDGDEMEVDLGRLRDAILERSE